MSEKFGETFSQDIEYMDWFYLYTINRFFVAKQGCRGVVDFLFTQKEGLSSPSSVALGKLLGCKEFSVRFGPLFENDVFLKSSLLFWIDEILCMARELRVSSVKITPPFHTKISGRESFFLEGYDSSFSSKGFFLRQSYSIVCDNKLDYNFAWSAVKGEGRRKIRRAKEVGVFCRRGESKSDFLAYLELKGLCGSQCGMKLLEWMSAKIPRVSEYDLYVAEFKGIPLAFQMVSWGKDVAILEGNCVSDYARENRLYGNHVLQWYVIQEAIRRGVRWIDWVGADPEPKTQKQKNITEFKLLWGGEIVSYNTYEYRFKNWRNSLFDFLKGCKDWKNRRFGGE